MAKSPDYFNGAATATAAIIGSARGARRSALIDKAHARIRTQGIKRDEFEALVSKAEKVRNRRSR